MIDVRIQSTDFDPGAQIERLASLHKAGIASFVACLEAGENVAQIRIDHQPNLARAELARIAEQAEKQWTVAGIVLIHRHGKMAPGQRIFFAGVASPDIEGAQRACAWMVAQVRRRAPFWRKEMLSDGTGRWWDPLTAMTSQAKADGVLAGPR